MTAGSALRLAVYALRAGDAEAACRFADVVEREAPGEGRNARLALVSARAVRTSARALRPASAPVAGEGGSDA